MFSEYEDVFKNPYRKKGGMVLIGESATKMFAVGDIVVLKTNNQMRGFLGEVKSPDKATPGFFYIRSRIDGQSIVVRVHYTQLARHIGCEST